MGQLGVGERTVRSTLSRMSRKGWIAAKKYGRRSQYSVTPQGNALLDKGRQRIFEPIITDWDGKWHLVMYSLPEEKRHKRHALRTRLTWLGFGRLSPGAWISPHNRQKELGTLLADLAIEHCVDQFSSVYKGPSTAQDLVDRCWELDALEEQYTDFIGRYLPEYREIKTISSEQENSQLSLSQQDSFLCRFWLTHEFQYFPLKDPNLPVALLSPGWSGFTARELVINFRRLLETPADEYVNDVMNSADLPSKNHRT
jgi:phenylacetic acid degradation operon negative regulatory protein